jgi:GNAT superfamily N-acetyltransferase
VSAAQGPRPPVTVQALTPGAWRLYRALRLAALQDAPDAFGSTLAVEAQRPPALWRARLAAAQASGLDLPLLARAGPRAAGLLWAKADAAQPRSVHLYQMWVAPGLRGGGIGRALLDAAIAWAHSVQARQVELGVTLGDTPALRLYLAAGFRACGADTPLREGSPLRAQAMRLPLPAGRA